MDSLTHIALGACIGEAFFEKGFGKKAMWWGALSQSIPDIDFIAGLWSNIPEALLAHRGFTHSLLFAIFIIPVFSLTADKVHQPHNIRFKKWLVFFSTELAAHLLLDSLNNYGIGWFEPFNHTRFAFNLIFVADPIFSLAPVLAFVTLLFYNAHHVKRNFWWKTGIIAPVLYLVICINNKLIARNQLLNFLKNKNIVYNDYSISPAPLQNLLWYDIVQIDDGFLIGYHSIFQQEGMIQLNKWTKRKWLLNEVEDHESLQKLIRFSQNQYVIEQRKDSLIFSDIRFGQIDGWKNPASPFVFQYILNHQDNSRLNIQKGRWQFVHNANLLDYVKTSLGIKR